MIVGSILASFTHTNCTLDVVQRVCDLKCRLFCAEHVEEDSCLALVRHVGSRLTSITLTNCTLDVFSASVT
jgi:hypothetical protein